LKRSANDAVKNIKEGFSAQMKKKQLSSNIQRLCPGEGKNFHRQNSEAYYLSEIFFTLNV